MQVYAAAQIEWYLRAEPEPDGSVAVRLLRLDATHYVEHVTAYGGEILTAGKPFAIHIDTRSLTLRRP
jgi:hypothetical protein